MIVIAVLFYFVLATIAYTYIGFPLLVALRAMVFRKPIKAQRITPPVSLIVAAHNEEDSIEDKLLNILQLDYPADRLQVIVASDGSTDRTGEIVSRYADRGVELLTLPRMGKAYALNQAVAKASGDVLVFSDANSMYATDAIRQLAAPFADETVGGVAGDQRYRKSNDDECDQGDSDEGERAYWNMDRMMKRWQSQAGHVISATGAIYAIRRSLFQQVPDGVTDDFVTSTRIILQQHRLVFAEQAAAFEPAASSSGIEFGRKVRVMTRGLRGVLMVRPLLNPFRFGFYSVQLFSHKVLRRLMVIPIMALYLLSGLLATQSIGYLIFFGLQTLFYLAATIGLLTRSTRLGRSKLLALPAFFCMVNVAALVALSNTIRGHRIDRWEPQRPLETVPS
ncbi:glycosyl transferase family protein [Rhodopirellula maiorica SM1]|uniref:Glycosyl transferase family protein n=1 Tax=Rhodopirellula maiorica SM1 TaxID=1265738 RepID=M5RAM1_9BACT|nr:glycosyltransferase family 2 protein [Rhodopirellula maiorica]EMI16420.1 glycosyl transferase family protein [Rhodopirellula maiorica SM1]